MHSWHNIWKVVGKFSLALQLLRNPNANGIGERRVFEEEAEERAEIPKRGENNANLEIT